MKIIDSNSLYRIVVFNYEKEDATIYPILLREWFNPPRIQARFDDNFAICNGYPDVRTMVEKTVGLGTMILMFGGVPEWIDMDRQGEFFFTGRSDNLNMN